jgi:hemerythrin-like domain-containing protein
MNQTSPIGTLYNEHHYIQKVIGATGLLALAMSKGQKINRATLRGISRFIRVYGAQLHHGKEEEILFPLLVRKNARIHKVPLALLVFQHEAAGALIREMDEMTDDYIRGSRRAGEKLGEVFQRLIDIYPQHIWHEEHVLFPMAAKTLNRGEQKELVRKFVQVERKVGKKQKGACEKFAVELEKTARARIAQWAGQ